MVGRRPGRECGWGRPGGGDEGWEVFPRGDPAERGALRGEHCGRACGWGQAAAWAVSP